MNEWWLAIQETARTPGGIVILVLAAAALAAAVVFLLWRGIKHIFRALLWLLVTLLALGLVGAGLYLWTVRQNPERARRLREATIESVRKQASKWRQEGHEKAATPADQAADILEKEWLDE